MNDDVIIKNGGSRVEKENLIKYGEIISKCWKDESFKKRFIQTPEIILEEANIPIEEGITYEVIEAPKSVQYVILPCENLKDTVQSLVKKFLNNAATTQKIIAEGCEVRIIQNTEDVTYLILPASPKELSKMELKSATGGSDVVTFVNVVANDPAPVVVVDPIGPIVTISPGPVIVVGPGNIILI